MRRRPLSLLPLTLLVLTASLFVGVQSAAAMHFATTTLATGDLPFAVVITDFNGDGYEDLAVANSGSNTVRVWLADHAGAFGTPTDCSVGSNPLALAAADLDGDGDQDIVVGERDVDDVAILLGDGDGHFASAGTLPIGHEPTDIIPADFDHDGDVDLAVIALPNTLHVFVGAGDGTFTAGPTYATGSGPWGFGAGDVEGDGTVDLAVCCSSVSTVLLYHGNGDGTFGDPISVASGSGARMPILCDVDRDGDQDLITADQFVDTVSVFLGDGRGGFAPRVSYPVCDQPIDVVAGDLDGDGNQDLTTVNAGNNNISILLGDGQGSFAPKIDYPCGWVPVRAEVSDLDADGRDDMVVANRDSDTITVMLNESPVATMAIDAGGAITTDREVTLSLEALGVSEFRLRDQGGAWGEWTPYVAPVAVPRTLPAGDGLHTIEAECRSSLGEVITRSDAILLDMTGPTTTDDAPAGWRTTSPVVVHLTADDGAGSGMTGGQAAIQYRLDGAAAWADGSVVTVRRDGVHQLRYRAVDAAGNVGAVGTCAVRIDTTAPTLRLASTRIRMWMSNGAGPRVRLLWRDGASTRARLTARVTQYGHLKSTSRLTIRREGRWQVVTLPWRPRTTGRYRLNLVLRDAVGHRCAASAVVVAYR